MDYILSLIDTYGLYIIFIIIILEYSCFPLPSEVVLPLAGAIGYTNNVNPFIMIGFSVIAGMLGATICYLIGFCGRKTIFRKKSEEEKSNTLYDRYGNVAISVGRIIPLCRTYISFIAGMKKHKFLPYILFTMLGIIVWNSCLILLGYLFYDNIDIVAKYYQEYKVFILIIIGLIIIFLIYKKIVKNKKMRKIFSHNSNTILPYKKH